MSHPETATEQMHQSVVRRPEQPESTNPLGRAARSRRFSWELASAAVDLVMLGLAALTAELGAGAAGLPASSPGWPLAFALVCLALFYRGGLYRSRLRLQPLDDVRAVLVATLVAAMATLSLRVALGSDGHVLAQTVRLGVLAALYLSAGRVTIFHGQAQARRSGEAGRRTLIIGAGRIGQLIARRLLDRPEYGLRPIGFLDKEPLAAEGAPLPVLGASWDIDRVVAERRVEHVIIAFSTAPHEVVLRILGRCDELGVRASFVPRLFEKMTDRLTIEHVGGLPLVSAHPSDPKGRQFVLKYALDRMLAALGLLLCAPLLALVALAILLSTGRPILYRQTRVGRDGRRFDMLKFRSMTLAGDGDSLLDALALPADTAPGGVEGEDRRTRVGSLLRGLSLDELPQLVNVALGQMSLIGPRPERPEFVGMFQQDVYRYSERHRVKSGITGWAQVHGMRGKTSLADRTEWDNYYIENWSLWLDFKILLMTTLAVVRNSHEVE